MILDSISAALLNFRGITMNGFQEFPGYWYHRDCIKGRLFSSRADLMLAGEGWVDSPVKVSDKPEKKAEQSIAPTVEESSVVDDESTGEVGYFYTRGDLENDVLYSKNELIDIAAGLAVGGKLKFKRRDTLINDILKAQG
jgi:hypothetical protein